MSTKLAMIGGLLLIGGCTALTGADSLTVEPSPSDIGLPERRVPGADPVDDGGQVDSSSPPDSSTAADAAPPVDSGAPLVACGDNGIPGDRSTLFQDKSGKITTVEVCAKGCEWTEKAVNDRCRTSVTCPSGVGLYCGGNGVSGAKDVLFRCLSGKIVPETRCANGCERRTFGDNDRCKP